MKRVLLHGFLGDPSVWTGITDGTAIALPGHHAPIAPTWGENLDAIASQIGACDLAIGYSLGARVALGLLAMGAVPRAILVSVNPGLSNHEHAGERHAEASHAGTSHAGTSHAGASHGVAVHGGTSSSPGVSGARSARRASDAEWARRFRSEPLADVLDAWEAQPLFATQARVPPPILAARRARRLGLDGEQLARSLESMGLAEMPDYRDVIDDRCTLIVGADDTKYLAIARSLSTRVHVIDRCGHDPLLEQPAALAKVLASLS